MSIINNWISNTTKYPIFVHFGLSYKLALQRSVFKRLDTLKTVTSLLKQIVIKDVTKFPHIKEYFIRIYKSANLQLITPHTRTSYQHSYF